MTFVQTHIWYPDALTVVRERTQTPKRMRNPLQDALEQNVLVAEFKVEGGWLSIEDNDNLKIWHPLHSAHKAPLLEEVDGRDIWVQRSEIDRLWPLNKVNTLSNNRGRPPKDWEPFWIEIVRLANTPDGLPDVQADLLRIMIKWAGQHMQGVDDNTMRDRLRSLYRVLNARGPK